MSAHGMKSISEMAARIEELEKERDQYKFLAAKWNEKASEWSRSNAVLKERVARVTRYFKQWKQHYADECAKRKLVEKHRHELSDMLAVAIEALEIVARHDPDEHDDKTCAGFLIIAHSNAKHALAKIRGEK